MLSSVAVRNPRLLAGAGALLLIAALSMPAVRSTADDFLNVFRVKSFQPMTDLARRPPGPPSAGLR